MSYRRFPFLGFKVLTDEEAESYDLDTNFKYRALVFEWFDFAILLLGAGKLKDTDGN